MCVWYVSKEEEGLEENCTKMLIALCVNYFYIFASLQWIYITCVVTKQKNPLIPLAPPSQIFEAFFMTLVAPVFSFIALLLRYLTWSAFLCRKDNVFVSHFASSHGKDQVCTLRLSHTSCWYLCAGTGFSSQTLLTCSGRFSNSFLTTFPEPWKREWVWKISCHPPP